MMTTPQLKAARALLDWTQQDLAKASGMHLNVINNLERGTTNPRQQTVDKLKKTLEDNGIAFLGTRGVELARQAISTRKIEGPDFAKTLIEDILQGVNTKKDFKNNEILSILSDIRSFDAHDSASARKFQDEKASKRIPERIITKSIPGFYPKNSEIFRVIEADSITGTDTVIYGDRVAFIDWAAGEIAILTGTSIVSHMRKLFERLWESGEQPIRTARAAED